MSRLAKANKVEVFSIDRPNSNFKFTDDRFAGTQPIRRLFSLARGHKARTIILEDIPSFGSVEDENIEIKELVDDYNLGGLKRISFWKKKFTYKKQIKDLNSRQCIGYAILKYDIAPSRQIDDWHIFEAVFIQYPHKHNYCPANALFYFRAHSKKFSVRGNLYAQQNQLNKACAQVALRSICATYLADPDITYREINELARGGEPKFNPSEGLNTSQIPRVIEGLGIPYSELNYNTSPKLHDTFPYQTTIYSGIESGGGALLAFTLDGPSAPNVGHIIPYFGHTFNEDSWAPHADGAYFKIGKHIKYIPSRAWMSSFIVHDDNFGANLCIPQAFLKKEHIGYVIELLPLGYSYSGALAEIVASNYFYSLLPAIFHNNKSNQWIKRLISYVNEQSLILRSVPISLSQYLTFLGTTEDWEYNREDKNTIKDLEVLSPKKLWMVEVSVPEIFSTNKRKLGEILLDAENSLSDKVDGTSFVIARFPERYVFFDEIKNNQPSFLTSPSNFKSHLPLLTR